MAAARIRTRPHYAARRCSASPWPACAPAAASRSAAARGWDAACASTSRPARSSRWATAAASAIAAASTSAPAPRSRSAPDARLGERCVVAAHERVEIGHDARLEDEVVLIDFDHDVGDVERPVREQPLVTAPVVIGARAVVGAAAGVLRGVTVGDGARVGVRAVVTHDVPPGARAEGTPARVQAPAR